MAKVFWDKFGITSKAVSDNKWLIIACTGFVSSMVSNTVQYFVGQEDEFMKSAMADQITVLAETYVKPKPKKPAPKVYKLDCGVCQTLMNEHTKEFH